jgi:cytochrome P450
LAEEFQYLRDCFFETLRIEAPVAQSASATFYEDVTVGGVTLKAHDDIVISIDHIQHDPIQWHSPDSFIPERFDPASPLFKRPDGGIRHPLAFQPFLGGQRVCMGKSFAEMMVRYTISIMLWHYDFELIDQEQIENKPPMNI